MLLGCADGGLTSGAVRTLIVVPTYFEAESIVELLERVRRAVPEADVVVVDDGSTDGTRELVNETAARLGQINLMCRESKSGLGAAYRAAFQQAIDDGYELLVEIDADLSHDPAALPEMLSAARAGADVVIGSRYVPGGRIDGWSRAVPDCRDGEIVTRRLCSAWRSMTPQRAFGCTGRRWCADSVSPEFDRAATASRWR